MNEDYSGSTEDSSFPSMGVDILVRASNGWQRPIKPMVIVRLN